MEKQFTTSNFQAEVLEAELPVFVDFYANWCGPCKMMAPMVTKLAEKYQGKMIVGKCDIDQNMEIADKYRVMNIPTFMCFKEGKEVLTLVGVKSEKEMIEQIDAILA
ncbi:thioredoxin [Lachnospiraceae bacterium OttesenSCG-928-D06]|nr:thioredoxin [Lachnospiraceae bacterium OttesenSCG-928-D06]